MADFCRQCSAGLGAPEGWSDFGESDRQARLELCEGCSSWDDDLGRAVYVIIDRSGACCGLPEGEPCAGGHLASVGVTGHE